MHSRTVEQVRSWDSRPFSGGLDALSELSSTDHTGAVVAADTWLFMLNGRVVGVFGGTIEDFDASGTVYSSPHDGLVLLFAMQEREGQTRARYFTEDTSLSEADSTLSEANFTGYIVLSENVLSGDYYLVYYGGTRRSVAFVGQSERLETGEDAYELAAEEVGLYEVKDVSLNITEIPDPTPTAAAAGDPETAVASTSGTERAETETTGSDTDPERDPSQSDEAGAGSASDERSPAPSDTEPTDTTQSEPPAATPDDAETSETGKAASRAESGSEPTPSGTESEPSPPAVEPDQPATQRGTDQATGGVSDSGSETDRTESASTAGRQARGEGAESTESNVEQSTPESDLKRRFRAEAEWRQTRAIPALDPDETEPTSAGADTGEDGADSEPATRTADATPKDSSGSQATGETSTSADAGANQSASAGSRQRSTPETAGSSASTRKLRAAVEKREKRIEELEKRLSAVESERSELEGDLEDERSRRFELESTIEDLEAERDRLQEQVSRLEGSGTTGNGARRDLQPDEALSGTNLFVRYGSKGEPTLEAIGDGVEPEAVNANLTLEHHTQFETDAVRVDGEAFRPFLESTGPFRFVDWVLRELPYELLETDNRGSLSDLFEAIPEIDRIEFDGSVDGPEGEEHFTVVMRNRMGEPLVVGEYHEGRNPVREDELQSLLSGAEGVAAAADELAGALHVTASFFEPDALELAESAAATGGLFSRQEKASYVSPDTGGGFHLGLIEDRSRTFHVTVPKL
jgi:hypothetical protein